MQASQKLKKTFPHLGQVVLSLKKKCLARCVTSLAARNTQIYGPNGNSHKNHMHYEIYHSGSSSSITYLVVEYLLSQRVLGILQTLSLGCSGNLTCM
jgi:hypothetical protein